MVQAADAEVEAAPVVTEEEAPTADEAEDKKEEEEVRRFFFQILSISKTIENASISAENSFFQTQAAPKEEEPAAADEAVDKAEEKFDEQNFTKSQKFSCSLFLKAIKIM